VAVTLLEGDCRALLPTLPAASVHCVVTSPPYWGLRDYGTATWDGGDPACDHMAGSDYGEKSDTNRGSIRGGPFKERCGKCGARRIDQQLGLEPTPSAYVANMVAVFREVRRVLRADGTLWLNMGDSYASGELGRHDNGSTYQDDYDRKDFGPRQQARLASGLKPKDLVGIPWRLAFALQADGWYLRADIIWAKPNPMPESVTDRPTKAHEYVFLLSKAARYFYDADAVREPATYAGKVVTLGEKSLSRGQANGAGVKASGNGLASSVVVAEGRNLRSVWTIPSAPFPDAHFATFPPALASRCIQAGTSEKGCCQACGAPWAREGTKELIDVWHRNTRPTKAAFDTLAQDQGDQASRRARDGHVSGHAVRFTTTGWEPSCDCGAGGPYPPVEDPVPCTVLDPFAGSGTVGEVAEQLGRHSLLLELSPTYVQMAAERTAQCGLFTARHGIC
jgi:DNA modification methylase